MLRSHKSDCLSERGKQRLWYQGDEEGRARGCCRPFWVKDTLDLKEVLKRGLRMKKQCRQGRGKRGAEESMGAGRRAARIPHPTPCLSSPAVLRVGGSSGTEPGAQEVVGGTKTGRNLLLGPRSIGEPHGAIVWAQKHM